MFSSLDARLTIQRSLSSTANCGGHAGGDVHARRGPCVVSRPAIQGSSLVLRSATPTPPTGASTPRRTACDPRSAAPEVRPRRGWVCLASRRRKTRVWIDDDEHLSILKGPRDTVRRTIDRPCRPQQATGAEIEVGTIVPSRVVRFVSEARDRTPVLRTVLRRARCSLAGCRRVSDALQHLALVRAETIAEAAGRGSVISARRALTSDPDIHLRRRTRSFPYGRNARPGPGARE